MAVETAVVNFDLDSLSTNGFFGLVTITAENAAVDSNGVLWMPESIAYPLGNYNGATAVTQSDPLLASDGSTPNVLYTIVVEGGNAPATMLVHQQLNGSASPISLSSLVSGT